MVNVEQKVIDAMKSCGIDTVLTLPCSKLKNLLAMIPSSFREMPLTREENGVGIAAGMYMAGKRPAMAIESTGLGNLLYSLCSLQEAYGMPLPILTSWRCADEEGMTADAYFGENVEGMLDMIRIPFMTISSVDDVDRVKKAIEMSYRSNVPAVILVSPGIWKTSTAHEYQPPPEPEETSFNLNCKTSVPSATETRYDMIRGISPYLSGKVVVSNIDMASKELYAAHDQDTNFYMLGGMGLASSIGLGLALGLKREVVALDGDGSLLMNPNALGGVAREGPENLTIVAFDNHALGSTGNQRTYSANMDLELLAKVYGIKNTMKVSSTGDLLKALENKGKGPRFIHAVILAKNADVPNIPLSPKEIKGRFMAAIGARVVAI